MVDFLRIKIYLNSKKTEIVVVSYGFFLVSIMPFSLARGSLCQQGEKVDACAIFNEKYPRMKTLKRVWPTGL